MILVSACATPVAKNRDPKRPLLVLKPNSALPQTSKFKSKLDSELKVGAELTEEDRLIAELRGQSRAKTTDAALYEQLLKNYREKNRVLLGFFRIDFAEGAFLKNKMNL